MNLIEQDIVRYYGLGFNDEEVAEFAGIDMEQLLEICGKNRKCKASRKHGVTLTNIAVLEALLKSAIGYKTTTITQDRRFAKDSRTVVSRSDSKTFKENPPSLAAIRMWLDNKDTGWKDEMENLEQKLNVTISVDGKTIKVDENDKEVD